MDSYTCDSSVEIIPIGFLRLKGCRVRVRAYQKSGSEDHDSNGALYTCFGEISGIIGIYSHEYIMFLLFLNCYATVHILGLGNISYECA